MAEIWADPFFFHRRSDLLTLNFRQEIHPRRILGRHSAELCDTLQITFQRFQRVLPGIPLIANIPLQDRQSRWRSTSPAIFDGTDNGRGIFEMGPLCQEAPNLKFQVSPLFQPPEEL